MKPLVDWLKLASRQCLQGWDQFWFTPRTVDVLAALRILTGGMLLYSHLVLLANFSSFIGVDAWIDHDTARSLHDGSFGGNTAAWSYLWVLRSPGILLTHHLLTIAVTIAMVVGFLSRISVPLAWFLQLMLVHRLIGSLFGLDQIVTYTAMYLALSPCGAVWSVDAWLRKRWLSQSDNENVFGWKRLLPADQPSVAANVSTRLLQLHLCVIYLFGGLAKARGEMWWDGTALWYAIGNLEYQSVDLTFLASYPSVFTALTHFTLFWEIFYCALIWPRFTRPVTLAIAIAVHGGIALFLGMSTFGLMMIFANTVFVQPDWIRRRLGKESWQPNGSDERLAEVERAEQALKKRYKKLKAREAQVEARNERLKTTKAKIRDRIRQGVLPAGDSHLNELIADEPSQEDEAS